MKQITFIFSLFAFLFFHFTLVEATTYPSMRQIANEIVFVNSKEDSGYFISIGEDHIATREALQILEHHFQPEHLEAVRMYLRGECDVRKLGISPHNVRAFLSASKWIDLAGESYSLSTFAVRLKCLHRSEGNIITLDALSLSEDPQFLIFEEPSNWSEELLSKIKTQLAFVPEWTTAQRATLSQAYEGIRNLSDGLNQQVPTQLIIRGNSGSGKTYISSRHPFLKGAIDDHPGPFCGIQNTDNIRRVFMERSFLSRNQLFRESVCLRKSLRDAMAKSSRDLSLVTDGWFDRIADLDAVADSVEKVLGALQIIDLDVPLEVSCLRVINRAKDDPFSAAPPFEAAAKGYQQIREARKHLIEKIVKVRDVVTDYHLIMNDKLGNQYLVAEKVDDHFYVHKQMEDLYRRALQTDHLEEEIATVGNHVIDTKDISLYGEGLIPFLGYTTADAMNQLSKALPSTWNLSLFFTGDTHSHLTPIHQEDGTSIGGIARRNSYLEKQRKQWMNPLVLDAGDVFRGAFQYSIFKGAFDIAAMNLLGYDVMTLGNHDLDDGMENFLVQTKQANFPILCANVINVETGLPIPQPYSIFERGGHRIAVVGLLSQNAWESISPAEKAGFDLLDPLQVSAELVPMLRDRVDIVIALSHGGYSFDIDLAKNPLYDVIIGGHSHTLLEEGTLIPNSLDNGIGGTLVHHSGQHGEHVGFGHLKIKDNRIIEYSSGVELMDDRYSNSPSTGALSELLTTVEEATDEAMHQVVACLPDDFPRKRPKDGPFPAGTLVAETVRSALKAEIGIIPSGCVRESIPEGFLTVEKAYYTIMDGALLRCEVQGYRLHQIVQTNIDRLGGSKTMQFAGLTYDILNGQAANILVNGEHLELDRWYSLALRDLVFDRELASKDDGIRTVKPQSISLFEAFTNYLQQMWPCQQLQKAA